MTKDGYEASYTGVGLGVTYDGLGGQIGVNVGKSKDFYGNTTSAVGVTAGVTAGGVEANIKGRYENARLNDGTELTTVSGGVGVKVNGIGGEIGGGVTTLKDADGNKQVIGGHVNAGVTAHGVTAGGRIDIDKSGARIGAAGLDMDIDGPGVVGYNAGVGYKAGEGFGTHAGMQNNAMKLADTGDNDD